jgi:hypothetical protein
MMKNTQYTESQLIGYRQHLIQDYRKHSGADATFYVDFQPGSKYIRVVVLSWGSHSAHSFIDAQGKIWKAAGWKGPAKNFSRGDITTGEFTHIRWNGV